MTKTEAMRITRQQATLMQLGFSMADAASLRRISMTLRRWHELECGNEHGSIERDEATGRAIWRSAETYKTYPARDMETGALKRLQAILDARNACTYGYKQLCEGALTAYIQGDPRGAALYIIRPGDIPEGQTVDSCYSRGICVA